MIEEYRQRKIGPFSLLLQRRGDEWDWSIYHPLSETFMASGTAPTIEVAESAVEEIIGQKPGWHSRV